MLKEFKEFVMRGNVLDLAVGVIIGGAFGKIVGSLVNDILMPLVGLAMGGVNFSERVIAIRGVEGQWAAMDLRHALLAGIIEEEQFRSIFEIDMVYFPVCVPFNMNTLGRTQRIYPRLNLQISGSIVSI